MSKPWTAVDDFTSDPFVPENQWDMIESGNFNQVPTIIGSNSDEGLLVSISSAFYRQLLRAQVLKALKRLMP